MEEAAVSKCFVAVGSIQGVEGSRHQVPLPAQGLLVKAAKLLTASKF